MPYQIVFTVYENMEGNCSIFEIKYKVQNL